MLRRLLGGAAFGTFGTFGACGRPPPRPAAGSDGDRRRLAGPRAADPLLRGVLGPGFCPLAAAPARRRVLLFFLRVVSPACRAAAPLDAGPGAGARPPAGGPH